MSMAVIYIHGNGGSADEALRYKTLFPECDVTGFDYRARTPWEAKDEFSACFERTGKKYDSFILIANSVGAYYAMQTETVEKLSEAFFISPVADMEKLISDMMLWSGVTEDRLMEKKIIETRFGETLSWEYLCYVREHPVKWTVPTHILYGENDELISFDTVSRFAGKTGASLDIMPGGEHWFHTPGQMVFLEHWIKKYKNQNGGFC